MVEISLRPYAGRLFFTKSRKEYMRQHKKLFKTPDVLTCAQAGRFTGGEGKDGVWTYLVYAEDTSSIAHEFCHVLFHIFEQAGIEPKNDTGEAFCYMLGALMKDAENG